MVTYSDLFAFVTMLCSVIALVITYFSHKKQCPCSGKVRHYFLTLICRRLGFVQLSVLLLSILYQIEVFSQYIKKEPAAKDQLQTVILNTTLDKLYFIILWSTRSIRTVVLRLGVIFIPIFHKIHKGVMKYEDRCIICQSINR